MFTKSAPIITITAIKQQRIHRHVHVIMFRVTMLQTYVHTTGSVSVNWLVGE